MFEEIDDGCVLGAFRVVRGERGGEGSRVGGEAVAEAGGGVVVVVVVAGVGLAAAAGALVEDGGVDLGGDGVVWAVEVKGEVGA